ncbi:MAG TPA: hypothetical protein VK752_15105 [Bryobacteraceae bacterium]|jgi:hypothetical protein|nr:hypothetical protein [Bryobacteraceae bacterium]
MTTLANFFKESDSKLGVFYPKHYVIATFPSFEKTEQAALELRKAGFSQGEIRAIRGSEILRFFEEFQANAGVGSGVMTTLSRAFGTEQIFADDDVEKARTGAGFLAVRSPEEAVANRIRAILEPFEPCAMHWYEAGGVQSLI